MEVLSFGCRRMNTRVRTFSSWVIYMEFNGLSLTLSLSLPAAGISSAAQIQLSMSWNAFSSCFELRLTFYFSGFVQWVFSLCPKLTIFSWWMNNRSFVNESTAYANGLAYVQDDGTVIMKADDTTDLANGVFRNRWVFPYFRLCFEFSEKYIVALSVRITSQTAYNNGLFILDLNTAPWGCGTFHTHYCFIQVYLILLLLKLSGLLFGLWEAIGLR